MIHARTETIENEGLHDEAEEEKRNNDFSNFIVKKDSYNKAITFYKITQMIRESAMSFHKAHLSFQRHLRK